MRVQAALTLSTTDISVFTLQRLYTFTTIRVKVPKNFESNHTYVLIRHNTTLPMCDCIGTLRGLYKYFLTNDNPLRFQATIDGQLLSKGRYPKRTEIYPNDAAPLALSVRLSQARVSN